MCSTQYMCSIVYTYMNTNVITLVWRHLHIRGESVHTHHVNMYVQTDMCMGFIARAAIYTINHKKYIFKWMFLGHFNGASVHALSIFDHFQHFVFFSERYFQLFFLMTFRFDFGISHGLACFWVSYFWRGGSSWREQDEEPQCNFLRSFFALFRHKVFHRFPYREFTIAIRWFHVILVSL